MRTVIEIGDVAIAAAELDADRARAILDARTRAMAQPAAALPGGEAILLFQLGGERLALPLARIAEVAPMAPATPLPGAPAHLHGLVVRRGLVHNLLDIGPALGIAPGAFGHMLLLRGGLPRLAIGVEAALGASRAETASCGEGGLTAPVVTADGGRAGLIDLERVLDALGLGRRRD